MRDTLVPSKPPRREAGFALVLAIMALMLLTFLGLTLATTTSTELQIATNYRWSQQALYNAEAGLEAAKVMLAALPPATSWATVMPDARAATWTVPITVAPGQPTLPPQSAADEWGNPLRNYENESCDERGGNVGYGAILEVPGAPEGPLQNKTVLLGQNLNGAVTVWVRRGISIDNTGVLSDDPSDIALVLTAEGSAPYQGADLANAFAQANRAVRTLEVSVMRLLAPGAGSACEAYRAQAGNGVSGSGFSACNRVVIDCGGSGGNETELLEGAMGGAARGVGGSHAHAAGGAGTMGSLTGPGGSCVQ
jgi:hypothetical protein